MGGQIVSPELIGRESELAEIAQALEQTRRGAYVADPEHVWRPAAGLDGVKAERMRVSE
jgi:hypothetical protein